MALTLPKSYAQDVTQPIKVRNGGELVFTGNSDVDTISVALYNDGAEYEPGGTVTLNCIRADGVTMVVSGAVTGNVASATLTQACCAVPGMMTVVMQLTSGGTGAIFAAVYNVLPSSTDTVGDAGTIIEDVAALIDRIDEAVDSIPPTWTELSGEVDELKSQMATANFDIENVEAAMTAEVTRATTAEGLKVNKPATAPNGTSGQLLRTNGDGTTTWVDQGLPTDAQTAEAVSDWLDEHPEATTTVEDASIGVTKLTNAAKTELTNAPRVYNALNYSVANNNTGNQATAINALIAQVNDYDTVYLPNGTYRTEEPIVINKPINFICDGLIRGVMSSPNYAVVVSSSYANVRVREIASLNSNTGCLRIYNNTAAIEQVNIEFDTLTGSSSTLLDTLSIESANYSVYYIRITGKIIKSNQANNPNVNGFSVIKNGTGTIGEIYLYHARISNAKICVYVADNETASGNVNSVNLVEVALETSANGVHFKNLRSPVMNNCRYAEQMGKDGYLLKLEGTIIQGILIGRTPIKTTKITLTNLDDTVSWRSGFYICVPVYESDVDATVKTGALVYGGAIHMIEPNIS